MEIIIPRKVDLLSSLNFCKKVDGISKSEEEYIYDYVEMSTVEPFGMLVLGSKIRSLIDECKFAKHKDKNFRDKYYAANMGYFYSVRQEFGKSPDKLRGNERFIPIKKIDINSFYIEAYNNNMDIEDYLEERVAKHIAEVLSRDNEELKMCIKYCITELLRNVYDHSQSKELWYAGQYWPSKNIVEIAILDEGIGISESLKRNKKIVILNDEEAIRNSLLPGVTQNVKKRRSSYSTSFNEGFGLYMIKSICERIGGDLVLASKSCCIKISPVGEEVFDTSFDGTAIRIRIDTTKINNVEEMITEFSKKGTQEALELKRFKEV